MIRLLLTFLVMAPAFAQFRPWYGARLKEQEQHLSLQFDLKAQQDDLDALSKLIQDNKWQVSGTPQIGQFTSRDNKTIETMYTITMRRKEKLPTTQSQVDTFIKSKQGFPFACHVVTSMNFWDERKESGPAPLVIHPSYDADEDDPSWKPRSQGCWYNYVVVLSTYYANPAYVEPKKESVVMPKKKVYKELAPEVIAEIEEEGFLCKKTDVAITNKGGCVGSLAGDWVVCKKGIPQFVFEWTNKGSALRKKCIERWYLWNKEARTLQRKVGKEYWVMTMWKSPMNNVWIIEKWSPKNGPYGGPTIYYVREGLHEPSDNDKKNWYRCRTWGLPRMGFYDKVTYDYAEDEQCALKVKGFPTAGALVKGSWHNAIEHQSPTSVMGRLKATIKGWGSGN